MSHKQLHCKYILGMFSTFTLLLIMQPKTQHENLELCSYIKNTIFLSHVPPFARMHGDLPIIWAPSLYATTMTHAEERLCADLLQDYSSIFHHVLTSPVHLSQDDP